MQSCPLCRAGRESIHTGAHRILHEALDVLAMHKPQRDAFYARVAAQRGEQAARDLVAVVNATRAFNARTE